MRVSGLWVRVPPIPPVKGTILKQIVGSTVYDWEGLNPTHSTTRYPAAATICFNMGR